MRWRRVAAVQEVTAMIVRGPDAVDGVVRRLSAKSKLYGDLRIDYGEDWIVLFAAPLPDESGAAEAILPALDGVALYEDAQGWWLPVGVEIAAPIHARASLRQALATAHHLPGPTIVVPHFADDRTPTDRADLFVMRSALTLSQHRLAA